MRHFLDPDFRPNPKTDKFCCVCQRDIKREPAGKVYLDEIGFEAIDSAETDFDITYEGLIGPECLKKIPSELVHT